MFEPKRICVELGDGYRLIAEGTFDPDFKQIFVYLEDHDGVCIQDLAIIGESYDIHNLTEEVVPKHGEYLVYVFADEYNEDYTHKFKVGRYDGDDK